MGGEGERERERGGRISSGKHTRPALCSLFLPPPLQPLTQTQHTPRHKPPPPHVFYRTERRVRRRRHPNTVTVIPLNFLPPPPPYASRRSGDFTWVSVSLHTIPLPSCIPSPSPPPPRPLPHSLRRAFTESRWWYCSLSCSCTLLPSFPPHPSPFFCIFAQCTASWFQVGERGACSCASLWQNTKNNKNKEQKKENKKTTTTKYSDNLAA